MQIAEAQSNVLPDLLELADIYVKAAYGVVLHCEDQQN